MQTVKLSSWVCALAISSGLTIQADDTPAQAAARAALLEKMQELNGSTTPAASVSGASWSDVTMPADAASNDPNAAARAALLEKLRELSGTPAASTPAPAPSFTVSPVSGGTSGNLTVSPVSGGTSGNLTVSPVSGGTSGNLTVSPVSGGTSGNLTVSPVSGGTSGNLTVSPVSGGTFTAPAPAPPLQDGEAAARARAALLEKLHELDGTPVVSTPAPAASATAQAAPVIPPVAPDDEALARAHSALMQELGVPAKANPANAGTHVTAARTVAVTPVPAAPTRTSRRNRNLPPLVFTPMASPVLPLTAAQAEQLQTLLAQYRADQITPQQYHDQRAAILAAR